MNETNKMAAFRIDNKTIKRKIEEYNRKFKDRTNPFDFLYDYKIFEKSLQTTDRQGL